MREVKPLLAPPLDNQEYNFPNLKETLPHTTVASTKQTRADRKARYTLNVSNDTCDRGYDGDHQFSIGCKPVQDRTLNSNLPGAPQTRTQQWERTNRK